MSSITAEKKWQGRTNVTGEKPKQKWTRISGEHQSAETPERQQRNKSEAGNKTPYEEYYFNLRQEINDLAKKDTDVKGIGGDVQLQFTLDNEGFLINGPIVLNNPDLRLVRSAVKTIKKAMPFQRFPKALKKDRAEFNIVVRYE